jgi:hypothetical protein
MERRGTLPVKTLPHAASTSRGVRLGLGDVEAMSFLDAVSGLEAASFKPIIKYHKELINELFYLLRTEFSALRE